MDKYQILSIVAPVAAPVAPATMLINILYHDMILENVAHEFAIGGAVASGIGAEASGMIAAYVGVKAFEKRKFGLMAVAAFAFVAYAVFMAVGISVAQNPTAMIATIVISIIAYFAVALLSNLREIEHDEHDAKDAALKLEHERTAQLRAQARIAKAGGIVQGAPPVREVFANSTNTPNARTDAALLARCKSYLAQNPDSGVREMGRALGISSSATASKYFKLAKGD
jgi:hypothetical protein